jgi:uncharacterized Zn finger protein
MPQRYRPIVMGCPICQSGDVAHIEYEKNSMLLYDCKNCGRFIMKMKTFEKLRLKTDFHEHRMGISAYVRSYFRNCQRPLELVLKGERGISNDSKDVDKILDDIKNKTFREIGSSENI